MPPRAIIIAGPNGAGKTTFAREFLPREAGVVTFINADLIAAGLSPFRPEAAALPAMRLMAEAIGRCVDERRDFAVETTLAGRSWLGHAAGWRARGYRFTLIFLRLPSADLALCRVRGRVVQGGHDVPEADVRRRFDQGWANFTTLYRPLADAWHLYDASRTPAHLLESGGGGRVMERSNDDADLAGMNAAMGRAFERAREEARRYGTPLVIWRDGRVVLVSPDDIDGPAIADSPPERVTPER